VVIVVTRIHDARRLARRLRKFLPAVGLITSRNKKDQPRRRVVVATPRYLGRGDVAAEKRHVCFAHGADDYLTKPFALAEVEARVRALLTSSGNGNVVDPVLRFGTLELDRERGEARVAGDVVA
jgi:CheY-like chemotaxis protein